MKKSINTQQLDLNLLRVFDAVFEDRNLLRAGKRLHVSQSAISHGITRLREALQDELFVRTPRGMEPTARAIAMAQPLRDALRSIHDALGVQPFDPVTAVRKFVLAANDYVTETLLTKAIHRICIDAPLIELVVRPSTRIDLAEQLDVSRIDVAVGVFSELPSRFRCADVWTQNDLIVMRKGHPLGERPLSVQDLASFPLVTISLGGHEEGAVQGYIVERGLARQSEMFDRQALECALGQAGLRPRYGITVPHSMTVPGLLLWSDRIAIVPSPLARQFTSGSELMALSAPYATPGVVLRAIWHQRHDQDPAHAWLRAQLLT